METEYHDEKRPWGRKEPRLGHHISSEGIVDLVENLKGPEQHSSGQTSQYSEVLFRSAPTEYGSYKGQIHSTSHADEVKDTRSFTRPNKCDLPSLQMSSDLNISQIAQCSDTPLGVTTKHDRDESEHANLHIFDNLDIGMPTSGNNNPELLARGLNRSGRTVLQPRVDSDRSLVSIESFGSSRNATNYEIRDDSLDTFSLVEEVCHDQPPADPLAYGTNPESIVQQNTSLQSPSYRYHGSASYGSPWEASNH